MRIFITGGTGLIGSFLVSNLLKEGHTITVLTRDMMKGQRKLGDKVDFCTSLSSMSSLDGYDAVINLAGEPLIGKCWTNMQKEKLCSSRWNITMRLTRLIQKSKNPPLVYISGSAVGYYGNQGEKVLSENSKPNYGFTHQLCVKWEQLALGLHNEHTRICILRTGIVLSRAGGMLPLVLLPFRLGLGAVFGKGEQYISWIHIQDMINAISFLLHTTQARGIFNLTAPNPVTNECFSTILAAILGRPRLFRIPSALARIAMGEVATMITEGQYVIPQHLQKLNFRFKFEYLDDALNSILIKKDSIG